MIRCWENYPKRAVRVVAWPLPVQINKVMSLIFCRQLLRSLGVVLLAAAWLGQSLCARAGDTVLLDEQFTDGERLSQTNTPLTSVRWYYQGDTTNATGVLSNSTAANVDLYFISAGQDIGTVAYFTASNAPKALADGESLTLRLSTRLVTSVINAAGGLRIGLFNSFTNRAIADYTLTNLAPANLFTNYRGYSIKINPGATAAGGVVIEKRTNAATATNLFSSVAFTNLAADSNGPKIFPANLWVRPSVKLTRLGSALRIETMVNDTLVVSTDSVPDVSFAFDTIGFFTSAAGLPSAARLRLDDVLLLHSTTLATNVTSRGTILSQNFNPAGAAWSGLGFTNQAATGSVTGSAVQTNVGTIDSVGGLVASGGLRLAFDSSAAGGVWSAQLLSGQLSVTNTESSLGKITLAFDLLVSSNRPVRVALESFTAGGISTGKLERRVHPAAVGFFQRFAFELSSMTNSQGTFDPLAPNLQLSFTAEGGVGAPYSWPAGAHTLDIDNVHLARPAYYVSPTGSDSRNGWTETNSGTTNGPFLTISKAAGVAKAGDIILIMGTGAGPHYQISTTDSNSQGVPVTNAAAPAAWTTFKAYPGHTPEIKNLGWHIFRLGSGTAAARDRGAGVSYLELRGLKLRGVADTLAEADKGSSGIGSANTTGFTVEGRYMAIQPHHVRLADNIICTNSAGGIGVLQADYVSVENNRIFDNCKWSAYAPSGISIYQAWDFGGLPNTYRMFVSGNIATNNQSLYPWVSCSCLSDGNGIIIDNFSGSQNSETMGYYPGRTLVQGNLLTGNGGSGMHAYTSKRVDVINNTSYQNSQVVTNGELWSNQSDDVRFYNNIMVSPTNRPLNPVLSPGTVGVYFYNNLYQVGAGGSPPVAGSGGSGNVTNSSTNIFVSPAVTGGNFRLTNNSPAHNLGLAVAMSPTLDLLGYPRGTDGSLDVGAYERQPMILTPPTSITTNTGVNFSLAVSALGDSVTYQWTRSGTNLVGKTNATLAFSNVTTNDTGSYAVVVATAFDSATNAVTVTVNRSATSVSAASSTNPSGYRDSVFFTATLPADATGNVEFSAISTNAVSGASTTSLSTTNLPRGTNLITVVYIGDAKYFGSTNSLNQIVTNHPPTANARSFSRHAQTYWRIPISALVTNASDVDADSLSVSGVSVSTNGATSVLSGGYLQYTNLNLVNDQFSYTVTDGFGGTNSAFISLLLGSTNEVRGQITNANTTTNATTLMFTGSPGEPYLVQTTTNLLGVWNTLWTTNAPAAGVFQFTDNHGALPIGFYRLVWGGN
ncbi:MAG: hypothetical protein RL380_571 [Verrucomicrobiota bacterium]